MSNVHVAVRVRPFSRREIDQQMIDEREGGLESVLHVRNNRITTRSSAHKDGEPKIYTFDDAFSSDQVSAAQHRRRSVCSSEEEKEKAYASQEDIFHSIGVPFLNNAFDGYNSCIFTYGQTGSGKTYTMMGERHNDGLMPRVCKGLFERIRSLETRFRTFKVEVSYFEIYMEKIKDLFSSKNRGHNLKVRNDTESGPYVQGIRLVRVKSYVEISKLLKAGNTRRTTGHTDMNDASSRSHAVFTMTMTERWYDQNENTTGEKSSRMSLVDLAGSERQPRRHTGLEAAEKAIAKAHVKESSKINRSLSTLGLVIKSLSEEGDALAEAAEAARLGSAASSKVKIKRERVTAGSPSRPTSKSYTVSVDVPTQDTSKTPIRPTSLEPASTNSKAPRGRKGLSKIKQALFGSPGSRKSKSKRGDEIPLISEDEEMSESRVKEMTPERGSETPVKQRFVPYRDSVLTWLLKDSLGGNSKTFMLATLSPSIDNFEETLSTLRYAHSCKQIVNQAVINEDEGSVRLRRARSMALELAAAARGKVMRDGVEQGDGIINPITYFFEWVFNGFKDPISVQKRKAIEKSVMKFAKAQAEYAMPDNSNKDGKAVYRPRSRSLFSRLSYRTKECSQDYAVVVKSRPRSNTVLSRAAASSSPFKSSPRRAQHPSLTLDAEPSTPARSLNVSFSSQGSEDDYIIPPSLDDDDVYATTPARVCFAHDSTCQNCQAPVAAMVIPFRTSSAHYFPKRPSSEVEPLSLSLTDPLELTGVPASPARLCLGKSSSDVAPYSDRFNDEHGDQSLQKPAAVRSLIRAGTSPEYHIFHEDEGSVVTPSRGQEKSSQACQTPNRRLWSPTVGTPGKSVRSQKQEAVMAKLSKPKRVSSKRQENDKKENQRNIPKAKQPFHLY